MIPNLTIDNITLELHEMQGHEHRIESIVRRAAVLVGQQLGERWPDDDVAFGSQTVPHIAVTPPKVDFRMLTNEEAAREISTALVDAILRRLQ